MSILIRNLPGIVAAFCAVCMFTLMSLSCSTIEAVAYAAEDVKSSDIQKYDHTFHRKQSCSPEKRMNIVPSPDWISAGECQDEYFGWSMVSNGDVNGDGFSDLLIGSRYYSSDEQYEGAAKLYLGSETGLADEPCWTYEGGQPAAHFGNSVAMGDINADGYSDVIIGAPEYDYLEVVDCGAVFVFAGSALGLSFSPDFVVYGEQEQEAFGYSLSANGDANDDGFADVLVGAPMYDNGDEDEGRAYLFEGSSNGLSATAVWSGESSQAFSEFGFSVSFAGDVNSDGYSDLLVGAPLYDGTSGSDEGRVWLYLGGPSGLETASWNSNAPQAGARFGYSLSGAGDINGDGFDDIIVGAPYYDGDEVDSGAAFVYLGNTDSSGLETEAAWSHVADQVGVDYGAAVAGLGDIDGNLLADFAVGAYNYHNQISDEGSVWVYKSRPEGLGSVVVDVYECSQEEALFGLSLAGGGDFNKDGFSDFLMGAPKYDQVEENAGVVAVYYGEAAPDLCVPACINGRCVAPDECDCDEFWAGDTCAECAEGMFGDDCYLFCSLCEEEGNGVCISGVDGECVCDEGWKGVFCDKYYCNPPCQNEGVCSGPFECSCADGWQGDLCELPSCNPECQHGQCIASDECQCDEHWSGDACGIPICDPQCSVVATCKDVDTCQCDTGFTGGGYECETDYCYHALDWSSCSQSNVSGFCFRGVCEETAGNDLCEGAKLLSVGDDLNESMEHNHASAAVYHCDGVETSGTDAYFALDIQGAGSFKLIANPAGDMDLALFLRNACSSGSVSCMAYVNDGLAGEVEQLNLDVDLQSEFMIQVVNIGTHKRLDEKSYSISLVEVVVEDGDVELDSIEGEVLEEEIETEPETESELEPDDEPTDGDLDVVEYADESFDDDMQEMSDDDAISEMDIQDADDERVQSEIETEVELILEEDREPSEEGEDVEEDTETTGNDADDNSSVDNNGKDNCASADDGGSSGCNSTGLPFSNFGVWLIVLIFAFAVRKCKVDKYIPSR